MTWKGWYWGTLAALAVIALTLLGAGILAQAAAPPHPKTPPPIHPPPVHPPPLHPPPVVVGPVRPRVIPRLRPIVIDDGPDVTVVRTVTELPTVPATPAKETPDAKAYKVVKVSDNYTVTLDMDGKEATVRLLGVAEPQVPARQGDAVASPEGEGRGPNVGQIGVGFMKNLLLNEYVTLAFDPDLDKKDEDGVMVAYLYRSPDGLFANLEVVRQGFGIVPTDYEFAHAQTFKFYQGKAKADGKGLWGRAKRGPRPSRPPPPAPAPATP